MASYIKFQSNHLSVLAVLLLSCAFFVNHHGTEARKQNYNKPYIVTRWYDLRGEGDAVADTPFTDCGSDGSTLKSVQVIPCNGDSACILKTGTKATFKLSFDSKVNSTKLTAKVHGIVAGVPIPFHVPQSDACTLSGIKCPIVDGTSYVYTLDLPVLKSYPKISVTVKWELKDENDKDVVCVEVPAKIR